jgi:flagella basal body P-ring formation protein FlgA
MRKNRSFDTVLPTDEIHVYSTTSRPPRGVYGLKYEIIRDGSVVRTISSPVRVTLWADAFVATRRIKKGERTSLSDFRVERIDATKCYDKLRSVSEPLDGMRAGRMIMSGKALERGMLQRIPVINRGDEISIKCRVGAMDIMTTGIAKEDGCLGDQINVVNIQTKRKIVAVVDGPGVAVVRQ